MINNESPRICVGIQTFRLKREVGDWPGQVGGAKSHHHSEKNLGFRSSRTKEEKERSILCKKKSGGSQGAWGILHFFPYYLHRRGEGERGTTYINQSRKVSRKINSYFLTILTMIFCLM